MKCLDCGFCPPPNMEREVCPECDGELQQPAAPGTHLALAVICLALIAAILFGAYRYKLDHLTEGDPQRSRWRFPDPREFVVSSATIRSSGEYPEGYTVIESDGDSGGRVFYPMSFGTASSFGQGIVIIRSDR